MGRAEVTDSAETWLDREVRSEPAKMIVTVTGLGVVFAASGHHMVDAMEENLLAHVLTRQLIARRGRARVLPPDEIDYLRSMESEKYREAVAAGFADGAERKT